MAKRSESNCRRYLNGRAGRCQPRRSRIRVPPHQRNRGSISLHLIRFTVCIATILCVPALAAEQPSPIKHWAIIASPAVQQLGLVDAVVGELSNLPDIKLVERDQIDAVLTELTLAETVGAESVNARLKLGKLLGADVLI